jgi:hypothetical protein
VTHHRLLRVARLVTLLEVDYFAFAARPGASARRAARHAARRRLLRLAQARRRLLRLHRASGCLGTSCGSSRLVAPLVVDYAVSRRLVVDYSVRRDFVLRPHWLYFSHAVRRG